jgi:signal transduction histidine kinase
VIAILLIELLVVAFCVVVLGAILMLRRQMRQLARLTLTLQASLDSEHDLRTPMATVMGLADSMKMLIDHGGLTNEQRRVVLDAIEDQGRVFFERLNHHTTNGARARVTTPRRD